MRDLEITHDLPSIRAENTKCRIVESGRKMCGIAGVVGLREVNPAVVLAMTESLAHRGPDDAGQWVSEDGRVILGHRRLSVIDPSHAGHQPMQSGATVLTFNGEIYNYRELAGRLSAEGVAFKSRTDTEVLLAAYLQWGESFLKELNGMFSFAIYDADREKLFCARDRFGEKPFLFHVGDGFFAFASEYKALFRIASLAVDCDQNKILQFLYHPTRGLDNHEKSVFHGVAELLPGHFLTLEKRDLNWTAKRYWEVIPDETVRRLEEGEAQERFRDLLIDSVRLRLRSDVPLGSCLSGGLDSSAIASIVRKLIGDEPPYHVFTGRFPGSQEDEWPWAKKAIQATNSISHCVEPSGRSMVDELADFIWHNELPVGSSSQYAQWCVFRLAKQEGVTVLLDGQGGDELLGGYEQYFEKYLLSIKREKGGRAAAMEARKIRERYPQALLSWDQRLTQFLPRGMRHWLSRRSGRGSDFSFGLRAGIAQALYQEPSSPPEGAHRFDPLCASLYEEALFTNLPVLLRYGDRNSMAHSREVRLPFCDHRLAEFTLSLAPGLLMGGAETKRLMRGAMKDLMPEEIRLRWNKQGFLPPQADWFRDGLLNIVEDVITDDGFRESGIWQVEWWRSVVRRFRGGENHLASMLWRPFINDAWRRLFVERARDQEKHAVFLDNV